MPPPPTVLIEQSHHSRPDSRNNGSAVQPNEPFIAPGGADDEHLDPAERPLVEADEGPAEWPADRRARINPMGSTPADR